MLDCLHNCHNLPTTGLEFVLQHATNIIKSNLHMKKVIEVSAFNPNSTRSWPNVSTLFFHSCFQVKVGCEQAITFKLSLKSYEGSQIWNLVLEQASCILLWSLHL